MCHPCTHLTGGLGGSVTHPCTPLQAKGRQKRVKAVADCRGDKARELTFCKGEVIVVTREEDEQSWVSASVAGVAAAVPTLVLSPSSFSSGCSGGAGVGAPSEGTPADVTIALPLNLPGNGDTT